MKVILIPRPDRAGMDFVNAFGAAKIDVFTQLPSTEPRVWEEPFLNMVGHFRPDWIHFEYFPLGFCDGTIVERVRKMRPEVKISLWCEELRESDQYAAGAKRAAPHFDQIFVNHQDGRFGGVWSTFGFTKPPVVLYGSVDRMLWARPLLEGFIPPNDVVFPGNNYQGYFALSNFRTQLVETVSRRFKTAIAGDGWTLENARGRIKTDLDLATFVQSGKVILGMNQFDATRYYPLRVWEGLSSPGALVYRKVEGMDADFPEVPEFDTIEEALFVIEKVLENWAGIGRLQQQRFIREHTWLHRIRRMVEVMGF